MRRQISFNGIASREGKYSDSVNGTGSRESKYSSTVLLKRWPHEKANIQVL